MGSVFRKTATKAVPPAAELLHRAGKRLARWKDRRGKNRTAPVITGKDGSLRIVIEADKYFAKYRDGSGIVRTVPTGCRDETAARSVLNELERRADKVRSKIRTVSEDAAVDHQGRPLGEHLAGYFDHLEAEGTTPEHRYNVRLQLNRLAADCGFKILLDLHVEPLTNWLVLRGREGMSARTRNTYRAAAVGFANWCRTTGRLIANPFDTVPTADEHADKRRQRRSLTEDEILRLFSAAQERPLRDALTVRRGERKGTTVANVRDDVRRRLEALGRERALIYKTLILTGLRKGELASLSISSVHLDADPPYLTIEAADEKARQGADLPVREDLAADLSRWLAERLEARQAQARAAGEPVALRLPPSEPLFTVPDQLCRIMDRDLVAAGIARVVTQADGSTLIDKRDDRGRTIDVHALRHTFGTLLSRGGVSLRTAQAAMRHSDPNLTANVYTDPRLLDVRGALDALPPLRLAPADARMRATGTSAADALPGVDAARKFAPRFAPATDQRNTNLSTDGRTVGNRSESLNAPGCSQTSGLSGDGIARPSVTGKAKKAGEGIRTLNFQHGRLALYH